MASSSLRKVLGLLDALAGEVELAHFRQTVDEVGDFLAEQILDLVLGGLRVLDRVVQQGRGDGGVVELEIREYGGDFKRDARSRVARGAALVAMRAFMA